MLGTTRGGVEWSQGRSSLVLDNWADHPQEHTKPKDDFAYWPLLTTNKNDDIACRETVTDQVKSCLVAGWWSPV